VNLTAANGFTSYVWTTPSGTQNGQTISATAAGNYTVTAHDANNCNSTSSAVNVSIATPQTLTVSPSGTQTICPGGSVNLTAANGFTSYVWTTPSGTQNGQTISATAAGNYTVTAQDVNNCNSTSSAVNVSIATPQTLTVSPSGTQTICPGGSVNLTAANGFTSYVWTTPSGTQNGQTISATAAGNYTVTAQDVNNCNSTSAVVTLIDASPLILSVNPSGIQSICPNTSLTLFAGNGFTNYTWSTPAGTEVGQSIETTLEGDYTVSAIGANSCLTEASTVTISFIQPEAIVISPSVDTTLCLGSTITYIASSGLSNYIWNTPTGTFSGTSITASIAGDYSVSAIGSNTCLASSNEVNLAFNIPQVISVLSSEGTIFCPGDSVELQSIDGFTDYEWSSPSGISLGQTIFASQSGNYSVNATDLNGCHSTSESILIEQGVIENIAITPNGTINVCAGGSVVLNAESGFGNYTWSTDETGSSLIVTSPGVYYVTASGNLCGAQSANVIVNFDEPGLLNVTADGSLILCANDDVVLTAETGYLNYEWSNGQLGMAQTFNNSVVVQVSASDNAGCLFESEFQTITQDPAFSISITPSGDAILCTGSTLNLNAETGYSNYVWSNSSLGSTLIVTNGGLYSVSAQNENGCFGTSNVVNVQEINTPVASFTYEQVADLYSVNFTCGQLADTYNWDFGNNQTSTEVNPNFTFPFDGTYPVTLIISNSCGSDTITVDVVVIKTGIQELTTVDALIIGPNPGDDKLMIQGNSAHSQLLEVNLFSVSGQLIMKSNNPIKGNFKFELDTSELGSGIYMVQLSDEESSLIRKWIKK
jgi:hypothetical protein